MRVMKKDLLSIKDLSEKEIEDILSLAVRIKKNPLKFAEALKGQTLALIFEKPSNRTYVSFQVGMYQMGGNAVYLGPEHIKLGIRETIHDVAKTLSRYVNGIVLRTFGHQNAVDMARFASVPVINGLSDLSHPCQALSDIFTIREKLPNTKNITLAYVGDGNNVCNSLLYACSKTGINMHAGVPEGYDPDKDVLSGAQKLASGTGVRIRLFHNSRETVAGADVVYTDVWASMGQEAEAVERKKIFRDFQVNGNLMALASPKALVMHCLPAHRGEEITDEVIDSGNSVVFDQAENRLHVEKAILVKFLGGKK
ncbi:MAG: ornithine carbamoyltransferase [Candidatus Omnitrophica bacterium]|nr:ornithine carbamoyltransferase [Candidatus Omnitrophota bacterium]